MNCQRVCFAVLLTLLASIVSCGPGYWIETDAYASPNSNEPEYSALAESLPSESIAHIRLKRQSHNQPQINKTSSSYQTTAASSSNIPSTSYASTSGSSSPSSSSSQSSPPKSSQKPSQPDKQSSLYTQGKDILTSPTTAPPVQKEHQDDHKYYTSHLFSMKGSAEVEGGAGGGSSGGGVPLGKVASSIDPSGGDIRWYNLSTFNDVKNHKILSQSHRTAVKQKLKFRFPYYGHYIKQVTIASGGFLYMSDFIHKYLTYTQYIAPLMANFDSSLGTDSEIDYIDLGDRFIVDWRNLHLKDDKQAGSFWFQVILMQDGRIAFIYKRLPKTVKSLGSSQHPVKVGISDAFYIDEPQSYQQSASKQVRVWRTIYEYHAVDLLADHPTWINSDNFIVFVPQKTCNLYTDCATCKSANLDSFTCSWCSSSVDRCSDGMDRHRAAWRKHNCEQKKDKDCPTLFSGVAAFFLALFAFLVLIAIGCLIAWVRYAYNNPNTTSGACLIEYRPSNLVMMIRDRLSRKSEPGVRYCRDVDDQQEVDVSPHTPSGFTGPGAAPADAAGTTTGRNIYEEPSTLPYSAAASKEGPPASFKQPPAGAARVPIFGSYPDRQQQTDGAPNNSQWSGVAVNPSGDSFA